MWLLMVDLWLDIFIVWSWLLLDWLLFIQQVAQMNPSWSTHCRAGRWHSCQTMGSSSYGMVYKT